MATLADYDAPEVELPPDPFLDDEDTPVPTADQVAAVWVEITVAAPNTVEAGRRPYDRPYRLYLMGVDARPAWDFGVATGMAWEHLIDRLQSMGSPALCAAWFMARLVAGEWPKGTAPLMMWDHTCEQWPDLAHLNERVTITFGGTDDSPEV